MLHRDMVFIISFLGFLYEVILMHYVEKTSVCLFCQQQNNWPHLDKIWYISPLQKVVSKHSFIKIGSMTIILYWCWSEGEVTNLLTLNTLRPRCSFAVNIAVSMRPIITSWRGVVFPRTAPNEISNVAVAKSADKSLKYVKHFNKLHIQIVFTG